MIDWTKYFDKIVCINFSQWKKRKQLMQFQLNRVGILNHPKFEWETTFCGVFEQNFCDMIISYNYLDKGIINPARISCMLGHLNAIKKAYYSGCKNILIIEDDERFLRDLNILEEKLNNIPFNDYNLILLDKFVFNYNTYNSIINNIENKINDDFYKFKLCCSAGCYILDRVGMQVIISIYDSNNYSITDLFFPSDNLEFFWKKACALKPLAVQVVFGDNTTIRDNQEGKEFEDKVRDFQMVYKYQQIRFDDYMMRKDGSPYYYGDYIET